MRQFLDEIIFCAFLVFFVNATCLSDAYAVSGGGGDAPDEAEIRFCPYVIDWIPGV